MNILVRQKILTRTSSETKILLFRNVAYKSVYRRAVTPSMTTSATWNLIMRSFSYSWGDLASSLRILTSAMA